MHTPSTEELLGMWENGLNEGPLNRALRVLEAFEDGRGRNAFAQLSIGERDARLLHARRALYGPSMPSTTSCPACAARLEWNLDIAELLSQSIHSPADSSTPAQDNEALFREGRGRSILTAAIGCYRIRFRLPNSDDLAASSFQRDAAAKRQQLLERCVEDASTENGEPLLFEQLPEEVIQQVIQEMERADPQSSLNISLACPACGHSWEATFDIASFLWSEIHNWAQRTLHTVHLLARRYGWREADILAMSPIRRQIYLEMASQ